MILAAFCIFVSEAHRSFGREVPDHLHLRQGRAVEPSNRTDPAAVAERPSAYWTSAAADEADAAIEAEARGEAEERKRKHEAEAEAEAEARGEEDAAAEEAAAAKAAAEARGEAAAKEAPAVEAAAEKAAEASPAPAAAGTNYSSPYYSALRAEELAGCGEVCGTATAYDGSGRFFPFVSKDVDCRAMFSKSASGTAGKRAPPPAKVPQSFEQDFTMGGRVPVRPWHWAGEHDWADKRAGGSEVKWTGPQLRALEERLRAGTEPGTFGSVTTALVRDFLAARAAAIRGRRCAVFGTQADPWLEALLLMHGAEHVTTIGASRIVSHDGRISTLALGDWTAENRSFACVAAFSSIEHAGLGRDGEQLNPFGDLQVMAKLGCSARRWEDGKMGASFFIGVPYGFDAVFWNAHRSYGPLRAPQLFANLAVKDKLDLQYEPPSCDFCSQASACETKRNAGRSGVLKTIVGLVRTGACFLAGQRGQDVSLATNQGLDQTLFFAESRFV